MKKIYLNLKRFDIPPAFGGVNRMAEMEGWAAEIVEGIQPGLESYARRAEFVAFFPELHLLGALEAKAGKGCLRIGCQGVSGLDTEPGGEFWRADQFAAGGGHGCSRRRGCIDRPL